MSQVPFPFKKEGLLIFKNPDSNKAMVEVETEIAESRMEIFQSWCYRRLNVSDDFHPALTLNFTNPNQQHMVVFDYDFAVTVIEVETNGNIHNIYEIPKQSNIGSFIKTFYGLKMVVLIESTDGLHLKFDLQKNHSKVVLNEGSV